MDGLGLSRAIKSGLSTSHIPIVLLTAKHSEETTIKSYHISVEDYLNKPFKPNILKAKEMPEYAFGFRGRMDESIDLVRSIRDEKYRYIRNFNPHRPGGQHIRFLWDAPNVAAWEKAYHAGKLSPEEAAWFELKNVEELYDCEADPDNVHNLALDPAYKTILEKMRKDQEQLLKDIQDIGFIPEGQLYAQYKKTGTTYAEYGASLPLDEIINAAYAATNAPSAKVLKKLMTSEDAAIRFWGATGCLISGTKNKSVLKVLENLLSDPSGEVSSVAAEALYNAGKEDLAIKIFEKNIQSENPYVMLRVVNTLDNIDADTPLIKEKLEAFGQLEKPANPMSYVQWKSAHIVEKRYSTSPQAVK